MLINTLLFFPLSLMLLLYSGGILVKSLTWMGRYLNLSEYTLSFILVAFATSLPELFIGTSSAFNGVPLISLGNLIGANILDVTLVLGAAILLGNGMELKNTIENEEGIITLGLVLLPAFLLLDHVISRYDGAFLIFVFIGYILHLLNQEDKETAILNNMPPEEKRFGIFMKKFAVFCIGTVLLLVSARIIVETGVTIGTFFLWPLFFIGVLIAIGSTLPELVFSIKSVSLRHSSMSLGNAFGSIILNMSFVLGLVATINPIHIENVNRPIFGILLATFVLLFIRAISLPTNYLPRWVGIFLIVLASSFIAVEGML